MVVILLCSQDVDKKFDTLDVMAIGDELIVLVVFKAATALCNL